MENSEVPENANESNGFPSYSLFVSFVDCSIYQLFFVFCISFSLMFSLWVCGFQIAQVLSRSQRGNPMPVKDVPTNQFVLLRLKALTQVPFLL